MGDSVKKLSQQVVAKALPQNLADSELIKQAMPGLQDQISSAVKNVNLGDLNPFSGSAPTTRISDDDIRNKLGMSPEQYYSLSGAEKAKADDVLMPKSFMSKVGDFFTDDPNSGWFDTMRNNQNLAQYDAKANENAADAAYYTQGTPGQSSGGVMDAFKSGLKKVATPAYLSGGANILAGVIGQNQAQKGMEQQMGAYDQALAKVQDAQQISGDAFNALSDSPEQLAYRAQAMKGLSDRAEMGLTPEDQAELQKINRQAAQQFKANNATIGQDMARRGMANSGLGLAQSMGAADQALQNQALAGQNQAAQSFANKQGALNNLANASNTALQSDYTRQLGKATNLSAVNQFNAQQRAAANTNAANTMIGKGGIQAAAAAQKGQATGAIGQVVGGLINPANKNKV